MRIEKKKVEEKENKNILKIKEAVKIRQEDFDVILEKGDKVQIMQEAPQHSKSTQATEVLNSMGAMGNYALKYRGYLAGMDESLKFYKVLDEAIPFLDEYMTFLKQARIRIAQDIKSGHITLY